MLVHRTHRWTILKAKDHPLAGICCFGLMLVALGVAANSGIGAAIVLV